MNELGRIRSLWLWGLIVTMAFAGCTGGYGKFYNRLCMTDLPPVKHAEVYAYSDRTLQDLRSRGYIVVGYSSFNGALEDKSLAVNQAKKNGADIVLLRQAYTGSTQTTLALPQYHAPQTTTVNSHQSGTVNAYGSGGYAYGNYSGTSTSYITTPGYTTYSNVPITIHRYDQYAVFLRNPMPK